MERSRLERFIEPPFVIERGESPDLLVIGFAGFGGWLSMHPFHFFALSSLVKYSRIMLRDPSKTCYLDGIPGVAEGYRALLELLRDAIDHLAPGKVMALGTSGGGTAALLFGHALKVDYVHAFSPFTYADDANLNRYQDREMLARHRRVVARLHALPAEVQVLLDVQKALAHHNGKTRYFVHYCEGRNFDVIRAKHIEKCPGVSLLAYPCDVHQVAESLARKRLLDVVLKLENQERLPQLVAEKRSRRALPQQARKKKPNP